MGSVLGFFIVYCYGPHYSNGSSTYSGAVGFVCNGVKSFLNPIKEICIFKNHTSKKISLNCGVLDKA